MKPISAPFGFPAELNLRFRIDGRQYRIDSHDVRVLMLLAEMYNATGPEETSSVFRLREQIRQIQMLDKRVVLNLVIMSTHSRRLRVLAIWMRGRCSGPFGTPLVANYCQHPDVQTRKTVVRALKRMSAWCELRTMAKEDPDPQIRRMATTRPPRSFAARLSGFTSQTEQREIEPVKRQLFVSPRIKYGEGRPAKSANVIRVILERIRRILVGHYD